MEDYILFFNECQKKAQECTRKGRYIGDPINRDDFLFHKTVLTPKSLKSLIDDPYNEIAEKDLSTIKKKMLSFPNNEDRILFARLLSKEFDSTLYNACDWIRYAEEYGYSSFLIYRSIHDLIRDVVSIFADFDIDLIPILKKASDYEKEFGDYNDFRDDRFCNYDIKDEYKRPINFIDTKEQTESSKKQDKKTINKKEQTEKDSITNYLNLNDEEKEQWLYQGRQYDTVQELAKFIAQSYTNDILRKVPPKRGGGLWNLARDAFQIENTETNRKTIENEFKLVYNPPIIPYKFK